MGVLLFLLVSYVVLCYGLSQVFAKALERPERLPNPQLRAVEAWIPGVNFMRWCELVGRKPIYALWLLVPIVNVFVYAGLCVDLARSFGRYGLGDAAAAVAFSPIYTLWLGRSDEAVYEGPVLTAERAYNLRIAEAKAAGEKVKASRLLEDSPLSPLPYSGVD